MILKDFLEEATIMKEMKHPNLVQLLGEYQDPRDSSFRNNYSGGITWDLSGVSGWVDMRPVVVY